MSMLLKNATYLEPDCLSWGSGDITVTGDKISALGRADEQARFDRVIDCKNKIVIPGLINSHAHSYTGYLKGTIEKMPLDIYMLYAIAGGSCRSPREIYICCALEALSMLKSGTTAVVDHFSQRPALSMEGLDAAASAYKDAGMRCRIATMFADRGFFETLPLQPGELPAELLPAGGAKSQSNGDYIALVEAAWLKYRDDPRVGVMLGTDGPQRCSDALLLMTGELEEKYSMGWQTHTLEAKTQAVVSRALYGKGLIEHMEELGVLNERTALVHSVWLSDREMELVARRGASVVHCPSSNLHLGSGIAPAARYRDLGIKLALGSDGGNCGATGMLEQIKLAALLQNVSDADYERWFSADKALAMDYAGGAGVFRQELGALRVGAKADICIIDTDNILWQPVNDLTRQLVYYENGSNVDTVIVGGELAIEGGKSVLLDEEDIIAQAREICEKLRRDCAGSMALVEKQKPYLRGMYLREIRRELGYNRFTRDI